MERDSLIMNILVGEIKIATISILAFVYLVSTAIYLFNNTLISMFITGILSVILMIIFGARLDKQKELIKLWTKQKNQ
jgi:hypothetical protein